MEEYITIETKQSKRNTDLFGWVAQAQDEIKQLEDYIIEKLGKNFSHTEIYPKKRKKFPCPCNCDNTWIWLTDKYSNGDLQILKATCANVFCEETFLILQKKVNPQIKEKNVRITDSFNNNSGSINFKA